MKYCNQNNIVFVNITKIAHCKLTEINRLATHRLHTSQLAFSEFVDRILPTEIKV